MKTRFFTFLFALLITAIGGANAAGTYTFNVTQGYTLTANDLQAINVLGVQNVISSSTSNTVTTVKNASGTILFAYLTTTYKCSLPASVSSANNLTSAITLDAYKLTTMGAPSMAGYSSIAMKFPDPVAYAEYNTNSTLTFHYDHLRSTFSTTYLMNTGTNTPGWSGKNPETVTFDSNFANYRPTSCYKWFEDMTSLKTINGLDNLRTENVTNMSRMFRRTSLTSLTLRSYFDTSNVTDMSYMFYGCSDLTFLSISGNFITTKVTNMNQMFYSCSSLTKLNLSNLYISSSTSTQSMLSVMPSLQELTLSTSLVNYLNSTACTIIGTDFSGNVDTPCALIYPTSAHLSNVQASSNYVKWNGGYFTCSSMKPYVLVNGPALTFFCDDYYAAKQGTSGFYDLNTGYYTPGWHDNRESITTVVFNSSFAYAKPTSCYKWFDGMKNLTSITGLRNLNTSNVTNMQWMFYYCPKLTSLDVSNFNTAKVTDMSYMFDGCSALTSLDLSNFNTANVTNMQNMFIYCSALTSLNVSNFNTAKVTNMAYMFRECSALTSLNLSNFNTANVTDMKQMFYKCSALTSLNLSNFNTAKVTNMDEMFNGCSGLTTLNVSNFNTANVTYMKYMFYDCKNLTSLNVSSFNTANVDDMRDLFRGCSKLTSLNLSNFNIGNAVTWDLLTGCTGLKSLNLSASLLYKIQDNGCTGIGTATAPCTLIYPTTEHPTFTEVTPTYVRWNNGYFTCANIKPYACLDGTSLTFYYDDFYAVRQGATDVYDMNTASNDPGWYASRTNITSVTFNSSFANARPTSCYKWFYGMSIAAISGLNYLNTSNVTNMYGMFALCQDLGSLDVSNFNTEKVTNMESMFAALSVIKSLDVSSFNTTRVTNMQNMFKNCGQLISLDLNNFTISSSTNTSGMLNDMLGLQTLTLSSSLVNYLNSNACTHIGTNIYGTLTTPCTLNYPAGTVIQKEETGPGWFRWRGGYFADAPSFLLGDVNSDDKITIADVTALVNIILGKDDGPTPMYNHDAADVNKDNKVTIADVTALVNVILGK